MGNKQTNSNSKQSSNSILLQESVHCPSCQKMFHKGSPIKDFMAHINHEADEKSISYESQLPKNLKQPKYQQQFFYQKVAADISNTKFQWKKMKQNNDIINRNLTVESVRKLQFQNKLKWFRQNVDSMKIPWESGADYMKIQKNNIMYSSYLQSKKVNMHKEVKIEFIGDKVNDAGGLLREWISLVIKEIFDDSTGLFYLANTDEITYKLKMDDQLDEQYSKELFSLLGIIIGKCIIQKIPILCYLDRSTLRQLCGQKTKLEDIYSYDKQLYKSWQYIQINSVEGLDLAFSIHRERPDSTIQEVQIIEDGVNLPVTQSNKNIYITSCIDYYCSESVQRSIKAIKNSLHKIIPESLLCVFQPYQMEMILNGVPFIDIKDWMINTDYKPPYSPTHKVIKWFWKEVSTLDQQQLGRLLKFCTGSSRPPIQGFKHLQTNRGNYSKFIIESNHFDKANPYPKGHTCFNRLELPLYISQEQLHIYFTPIFNKDLDGVFGLD